MQTLAGSPAARCSGQLRWRHGGAAVWHNVAARRRRGVGCGWWGDWAGAASEQATFPYLASKHRTTTTVPAPSRVLQEHNITLLSYLPLCGQCDGK